ncbi:RNA-binding transcriptional accessory protein [Pectobacterium aroidearum]|uniref:RNA-binding transcriptional accessory protein n=1 Tax=Pectobacterium aroidearum TaxID=1201031 RepID=A0ABR5ZJF5_9GAMM|nr:MULTISPECIES: Tex family protein [Pectobacterium]MBA0206570.1 RNA-binding transcriptional accessory protein [Pectobacterium aroidearum]MBA5201828.1 RNA-binding transcriptional accessory protein [Pectobacterium aroidearum]MBA5230197.1 RNA-binding transcriptional accessory protein [Pectobacterium aroidearum]MBA5234601.1 RNA-binding transcriptional accessory protein [Pectobacterium aroidearum]MBA5739795.1 RNA-binding transcriptional accessory protein [Pectobacterium aroidearum]
MNDSLSHIIASELQARTEQVDAAVRLLDEGNTVPFIARYRKEVTGGLDDTQLRQLETRLGYLRELEDRRQTILKSIDEQGKLTPQLATAINGTLSKTELEDLYLPYKPKRRTRGQIAIEAGLEPLADGLWQDPSQDPELTAQAYVDAEKGVADVKAALDGARYILMERFAEDATLLAKVRNYLWKNAHLVSRVVEGKEEEGAKFRDYFDHHEPIAQVPSHRALAMFRGRNEGVLQLALNADPQHEEAPRESYCEQIIIDHLNLRLGNAAADSWRRAVISWTWRIKVLLHLETELMGSVREKAEDEAINVFARNMHDLLMAAPAGMRATMGLDPGLRTGVKVAVVDATGKLVATDTIYPHTGQAAKAATSVAALCRKYQVELVAIGNGTASRETERFFLDTQKQFPDINAQKVIVSEAGASVYSASELAALEFPDLDVSLRGAVSIARRLQDPLAELVKIDPKSIGVGQYQHDVSQSLLAKKLDAVVEDCVNAVGVDLNTASVALLTRVAGLTRMMAQNIVTWRDENGRFHNREQLLKVSRLGPKAFEQCAGFLRINHGDNPLDASTVHPEAYPVVERILAATEQALQALMGNPNALRNLKPADFTDERFGVPTVTDIIKELEKPGRDPRPEFKTASFAEGVETLNDLLPGMILEGAVTNVTNFGAFVDIGVHQDGLVHISSLADRFVDDPHKVVKAGDIVKVKVMEVDLQRKRIALTMRLDEQPGETSSRRGGGTARSDNNASPRQSTGKSRPRPANTPATGNSAMGDALAAAFKKR